MPTLANCLLPALLAVAVGVIIVFLGKVILARLPGIKPIDAIATAGLFGAVSASTFAAGMLHLDDAGMHYEAWVSALYPFMDIPALVLAIVLGRLAHDKTQANNKPTSQLAQQDATSDNDIAEANSNTVNHDNVSHEDNSHMTASQRAKASRPPVRVKDVIVESLQGSALSALILGIFLGLVTRPESVYESFYNPLFRGFLSILMIIMGIEAWQRLSELRRVAHWYAVYAALAPIVHGGITFALGAVAHHLRL